MKRKVISIIGLALFVGAVAFNVQMNSANNQTNDVTLKNIEALTASAEEDPIFAECCDNIWTIKYSAGTTTVIECTSDGEYACTLCCF